MAEETHEEGSYKEYSQEPAGRWRTAPRNQDQSLIRKFFLSAEQWAPSYYPRGISKLLWTGEKDKFPYSSTPFQWGRTLFHHHVYCRGGAGGCPFHTEVLELRGLIQT